MDMRQELRKRYASQTYDGARGSGQFRERERRPGHYVRRPRAEYAEYQPKQNQYQNHPGDRKRRPRQHWVVKGDSGRQSNQDVFICETRQKTSSVFDCISEHDDTSADPAGQGRRDQ